MQKNINILDELSLTKSASSDRPGAVTQLLLDPRSATLVHCTLLSHTA